ncbi:hypothetical protein CMETHOX_25130 [Lacrimispora indolis]|nr:hypothetical protein CMETHOX_25130 [[Clostridium] methoxybenzovorans]
MKKKASLLISGITTVAMLAVAVGSFAAWETLTGGSNTDLDVSTSTPVTLEVKSTDVGSQDKLLRPSAQTISDDAKESTIVKVGTMNVILKGTAKNKVTKVTATTKVFSDQEKKTSADNLYDVVIVTKDTANVTNSTTSITDAEMATALAGVAENSEASGLDYDVYLKFKTDVDLSSIDTEKAATRYVSVDLTAAQV